jgi:hypothetical protein
VEAALETLALRAEVTRLKAMAAEYADLTSAEQRAAKNLAQMLAGTMRELDEARADLAAQAPVIKLARTALQWWPTVVDSYPTPSAPWIGSLRLALEELDRVGVERASR